MSFIASEFREAGDNQLPRDKQEGYCFIQGRLDRRPLAVKLSPIIGLPSPSTVVDDSIYKRPIWVPLSDGIVFRIEMEKSLMSPPFERSTLRK